MRARLVAGSSLIFAVGHVSFSLRAVHGAGAAFRSPTSL